jgi:ribosomal protein S12 methylthiotransferase accessory factor YcaO
VSELSDEHEHEEHDHEEHQHEEQEQEQGEDQETLDAMLEAIRAAKVAQLILSTVSTLASVAYGKLEMGDLPETKIAIDAIDVLLPLLQGQVDEGILKDFEQALTNLKLAYADAVGSSD